MRNNQLFTNPLIVRRGSSKARWVQYPGNGTCNWRWMLGLEILPAGARSSPG